MQGWGSCSTRLVTMPRVYKVRTWDEIMSRVEFEPMSGCWLWAYPCTVHGYGVLVVRQKHFVAHRVFFEHFKGPIPDGLFLDHKCRVRCCVNPDHLRIVTPRENALFNNDSVVANNYRRRTAVCGHPLVTQPGRRFRSCPECT